MHNKRRKGGEKSFSILDVWEYCTVYFCYMCCFSCVVVKRFLLFPLPWSCNFQSVQATNSCFCSLHAEKYVFLIALYVWVSQIKRSTYISVRLKPNLGVYMYFKSPDSVQLRQQFCFQLLHVNTLSVISKTTLKYREW